MRSDEDRAEVDVHHDAHDEQHLETGLQEAISEVEKALEQEGSREIQEAVDFCKAARDEFWDVVKQRQSQHDNKHRTIRQQHEETRQRQDQEFRQVSERYQRIPQRIAPKQTPRKTDGGMRVMRRDHKMPGRLSQEQEGLGERRVMLGRMLGKSDSDGGKN